MAEPLGFTLDATDGDARAATMATPHGTVATPMFMPVGTRATVKGLTPEQVGALGTQILLANTYHLAIRPGSETIAELGGLHAFMDWDGPILTDSGGFQVFSHRELVRLSDDGVSFIARDYGGEHLVWTPEDNMRIQEELGADIVMQLDVCPPYPADRAELERAVDLSARWAERCFRAHCRGDQALFGIVQGSMDLGLRRESIRRLREVGDWPGFGIGGYSVGEPHDVMYAALEEFVASSMPVDRPRYLMGVGDPETLVRAVGWGVDLFDCVLPTRTARLGTALTSQGRLNLKNARFERDAAPLDPDCGCPTCTHGFSRAYLHHLVRRKEMLGATLLSAHNLWYLIHLMGRVREAVLAGRYRQFLDEWLASPAAGGWNG